MFPVYDVIVVGAGHAGCEAAAAAANMGSKVLLVTMNLQTIAQMSCNPAMGGIAKGQIVREVDALGGYSGIVTDQSMIQFRMLNRSKGPAMWSPRAQSDRMLFSQKWREMLEATPNLSFYQDMVNGLLIKDGRCTGIVTGMGNEIQAKSVVLTNGTFLNGIIHIGEKTFGGGRMAEKAATGITEQLVSLGLQSDRLKTGTPPRIDGRSLDYSKMEEQKGDDEISGFSYLDVERISPAQQRSCWIAYTNVDVHDSLKTGFDRSPMFTGRIEGTGPRYCPSIEDKINRFADRDRHQLFVEPEGFNTVEIYLNGFSTSLPESVQYQSLIKIPGFENCRMFRPGYAIEYDYFPPHQLNYSLETKEIEGLFFAGQINGTTGYEEAACQGLMAGINAHQYVNKKEVFVLDRSEAYIGVLIDDLITKGTDEPYRMFTSRAEFRTLLRQDNADSRLTPKGIELGIVDEHRKTLFDEKMKSIQDVTDIVTNHSIYPDEINEWLKTLNTGELSQKTKTKQVLSRPQIDLNALINNSPSLKEKLEEYLSKTDVLSAVEIDVKYEGYIARERDLVEKMNRLEYIKLNDSLDYNSIESLSLEARQKLSQIRPATLGQASRISGINPSDISVLMVYIGR
jgi:tRNA uridine 5-carboxymethylaminomethyl modification enzyme